VTNLARAASIVAAAIATTTLLAGCGGTTRATGAGSVDQRALVVLRRLAGCVRAHGLPAFPDPQVGSDGVPRFPNSAPRVPVATQQACRSIAAELPASYTETPPVSHRTFEQLLQLARCIRAHGVPDWPDPNALGQFPIDARIQQTAKRAVLLGLHACARVNPDPNGVDIVRARP
jgi:hypothetical protein